MKIHDGQKYNQEIIQYKEFLKSPFWKKLRVRFFTKKSTIKVCFICGANKHLHLHHRSYKKIKHITTNNLICLCKDCHFSVHFKENIRVKPPVNLNDYIKLAVEYTKKTGKYPFHLIKYKNLVDKYSTLTNPEHI